MATPSDDQLAAEAETVLREFQKEWDAVAAKGGNAPTERMKELAVDPFLAQIAAIMNKVSASGVRSEGPVEVRVIRPLDASKFPGAAVGLLVCQDGRRVATITKAGKKEMRGGIMLLKLYFKRVGGHLVAFDGESHEVTSCPV